MNQETLDMIIVYDAISKIVLEDNFGVGGGETGGP